MKKILKYITLLLLALIMLSGCQDINGEEKNNLVIRPNPYTERESNIVDNDNYILADFESYYECSQIKYGHSLGKITQINDKEYVTRGKQCIKLDIFGYENFLGVVKPYIKIYTTSQYFQKTDFSDCDKILMDIHNSNDYEASLIFKINFSGYSKEKVITLSEGMNNIVILLNEEFTDSYNNIISFEIVFDRGSMHAQTEVFYIDNIRAHKK